MRMHCFLHALLLAAMTLALSACGSSGNTNNDGGTEGCGNGVLEGTEECDDGNNVDGDGCSAACVSTATCGDDVIEGSEECEPGSDDNCFPAGHVDECTVPRQAFRWDSFGVTDPHLYQAGSCGDITFLLNITLDASVTGDKAGGNSPEFALDGVIDLGFVMLFRDLAQGDGEQSSMDFVVSDCTPLQPSPDASGGPTPCSPTVINPPNGAALSVTTKTDAQCLAAVPDTTDFAEAGNRTVEPGDHGCFVNENPVDLTVTLGSVVSIPLSNVRIAGQWDATPPTGILNGFAYGFITEEDADAQVIDPRTPLVAGQTLSATLSGSEDCDHRDELDGVTGWWVYFPFTAEEVPWKGGLTCGDGDLDLASSGGGIDALDRDETCDPAIISGEGVCPELVSCPPEYDRILCADECDDGFACTEDTVNVGDPCNVKCFHRQLPDTASADGCCPLLAPNSVESLRQGAPSQSIRDVDCSALCGDGTLQDWERCEEGDDDEPCTIASFDCDDADPCTDDFITTNGTDPIANTPCLACSTAECSCGHTPNGGPGCE